MGRAWHLYDGQWRGGHGGLWAALGWCKPGGVNKVLHISFSPAPLGSGGRDAGSVWDPVVGTGQGLGTPSPPGLFRNLVLSGSRGFTDASLPGPSV